MGSIALTLLMLKSILLSEATEWSYDGLYGPERWKTLFPNACAGRFQSPINIFKEETVYDPALKDLVIFYDPPTPNSKFIVRNNGHSIQVDTRGKFFVSNGGLQNVYSTAQFHFHWGQRNHDGSEHTIDGIASPMELHIVNWNSEKYGSLPQAAIQPDGLAVLGVLFEISDQSNPVLDSLIDSIVKVLDPDLNMTVEIPAVSTRQLLPQHLEYYYRYNGSLTTPPCSETVTWTIFKEKFKISLNQLDVFRQAMTSAHPRKRRSLSRQEKTVQNVKTELGTGGDIVKNLRLKRKLKNSAKTDRRVTRARLTPGRHALANNYRPVQPLNGRTVYRSFMFADDSPLSHDQFEKK